MASSVPDPRPLSAFEQELAPASPRQIEGATVRVLLLLIVVGFGWAWWSAGDAASAFALAPAFGVATLAIAAVVLDRVGFGVGGTTASVASAIAGAGGYLLAWQRRRGLRRR